MITIFKHCRRKVGSSIYIINERYIKPVTVCLGYVGSGVYTFNEQYTFSFFLFAARRSLFILLTLPYLAYLLCCAEHGVSMG